MAKPEAERGGRGGGGAGGWASLLALGVALTATAALALCVACLDTSRREHILLLQDRLEDLQTQLDSLQARIENVTVSVPEPRKEEEYEEQVYEYDEENSYEEEYDEDEEEEPNPKATVKRTAVLGESRLATSSEERRRAAREVRAVPVHEERYVPSASHLNTFNNTEGLRLYATYFQRSPQSVAIPPVRHKYRFTETLPNHKKPTQRASSDRDTHQHTTPNYQEQRRAPEATVKCRHRCRERNRNAKFAEFSGEEFTPESQPCNILAAHFVGSVAKYNMNEHHHYFGNHILYHPSGLFEDWVPADWMVQLNKTSHFPLQRGKLTIEKPGVYLIYAQVYYATIHDHSGFHIKHNGHEVAQCMTTTISKTDKRPEAPQEWMKKRNTCFTAVTLRLVKSDRLWLSEVEGHRNTSFRGHHSYFGLIQLIPTPT